MYLYYLQDIPIYVHIFVNICTYMGMSRDIFVNICTYMGNIDTILQNGAYCLQDIRGMMM